MTIEEIENLEGFVCKKPFALQNTFLNKAKSIILQKNNHWYMMAQFKNNWYLTITIVDVVLDPLQNHLPKVLDFPITNLDQLQTIAKWLE